MGFKLSRHLLDTSSTPGYLSSFQTFSYRNLNRSSTTRWIDRESSWTLIASRYLMDRSSFCSCAVTLFLDTSSTASSADVVFLDTFLNRWLDTSIYRELLKLYILVCRDPVLISSICLHLFTSQITLSHSKPLSQVFFKLFQVFFTW